MPRGYSGFAPLIQVGSLSYPMAPPISAKDNQNPEDPEFRSGIGSGFISFHLSSRSDDSSKAVPASDPMQISAISFASAF